MSSKARPPPPERTVSLEASAAALQNEASRERMSSISKAKPAPPQRRDSLARNRSSSSTVVAEDPGPMLRRPPGAKSRQRPTSMFAGSAPAPADAQAQATAPSPSSPPVATKQAVPGVTLRKVGSRPPPTPAKPAQPEESELQRRLRLRREQQDADKPPAPSASAAGTSQRKPQQEIKRLGVAREDLSATSAAAPPPPPTRTVSRSEADVATAISQRVHSASSTSSASISTERNLSATTGSSSASKPEPTEPKSPLRNVRFRDSMLEVLETYGMNEYQRGDDETDFEATQQEAAEEEEAQLSTKELLSDRELRTVSVRVPTNKSTPLGVRFRQLPLGDTGYVDLVVAQVYDNSCAASQDKVRLLDTTHKYNNLTNGSQGEVDERERRDLIVAPGDMLVSWNGQDCTNLRTKEADAILKDLQAVTGHVILQLARMRRNKSAKTASELELGAQRSQTLKTEEAERFAEEELATHQQAQALSEANATQAASDTAEAANLKEENANLKQRLEELTAQLHRTNEEQSALQEAVAGSSETLEQLQAEVERLKADNAKLLASNLEQQATASTTANSASQAAEEKLAQTESARQALQVELDAARKQSTELQARLDKKEASLAEAQQQRQTAEEQSKARQKELEQLRANLAEITQQRDEALRERDATREKVASLEKQLDEAKSKADAVARVASPRPVPKPRSRPSTPKTETTTDSSSKPPTEDDSQDASKASPLVRRRTSPVRTRSRPKSTMVETFESKLAEANAAERRSSLTKPSPSRRLSMPPNVAAALANVAGAAASDERSTGTAVAGSTDGQPQLLDNSAARARAMSASRAVVKRRPPTRRAHPARTTTGGDAGTASKSSADDKRDRADPPKRVSSKSDLKDKPAGKTSSASSSRRSSEQGDDGAQPATADVDSTPTAPERKKRGLGLKAQFKKLRTRRSSSNVAGDDSGGISAPIDSSYVTRDPKTWTCDELCMWLASRNQPGISDCVAVLQQERVSGQQIKDLSSDGFLKNLGLSAVQRKSLKACMEQLPNPEASK